MCGASHSLTERSPARWLLADDASLSLLRWPSARNKTDVCARGRHLIVVLGLPARTNDGIKIATTDQLLVAAAVLRQTSIDSLVTDCDSFVPSRAARFAGNSYRYRIGEP